jgi:hypothetical protein
MSDVDFYANTFLGKTLFKHAEGRIARLRPIAIARPSKWEPIVDVAGRFPSDGSVFCREEAAVGRPEGAYFVFRVVPNEGQDSYRAVDVEEPLEVIRDFGRRAPDDQRRIAVIDGLPRGHQRLPRAILPLKGNRYVMPPLFEDRETGLWKVAHGQDLARVPVYAADGLFDGDGPVDAGRFFALPGQQPAKRVGLVNWEVDGDYLETLVGYVRRIVSKTPDPSLEGLTKAVVTRLRSALTSGEPLADQLDESDSIRDRLPSFLSDLEGGREGGRRIAEALLNHSSVRTEVAALSQAERDAMHRSLEVEMRADVARRIEAELQGKRIEIAAQERVLAGLEESIGTAAGRLEAVRMAYEADLTVLTDGLSEFRTEVAKTDAALGRIRSLVRDGAEHGSTDSLGRGFNWCIAARAGAVSCAGADLASKLLAAADALSVSRHVMIGLDVATRSGDLPCLVGPGADILLGAYVHVLSAGSIYYQPVDATMLGPDDMLRRPGSGSDTPLADAWNAARLDPGRPYVVCVGPFDGLPLPAWFAAFADLYRSARPLNLFVVARASGAGVGAGLVVDARATAAGAVALMRGALDEIPATYADMASMADALTGSSKAAVVERFASIASDDFDARRALARAKASLLWEPLFPRILEDVARWPATSGSTGEVRIQDGSFPAAERSEIGEGHD